MYEQKSKTRNIISHINKNKMYEQKLKLNQ